MPREFSGKARGKRPDLRPNAKARKKAAKKAVEAIEAVTYKTKKELRAAKEKKFDDAGMKLKSTAQKKTENWIRGLLKKQRQILDLIAKQHAGEELNEPQLLKIESLPQVEEEISSFESGRKQ
ncbi:hypothetical protein CYMTET_21494 [Cymbomonas tetramitiformis]|uniref:Uncharacterized protein n=1 Tax=Cymbomonas tetramitiformis TaxID=36881 RepID=A0AAE0L2X0_9CHLO|nr:hypothetical protein CYMTET_21494 [Cymbomonas tetramitiformis]